MALTRFRFGAAAVIGMILIMLYAVSETQPRRRTAVELEARRLMSIKEEAEFRARIFATQERIARVGDSVRAALRAPASSPIRVAFGPNVRASLRAPIDSLVATAADAVGGSRIGVDVVVVSDTGQAAFQRTRPPGGIRLAQILPSAPGERCVSLVILGRNATNWRNSDIVTDAGRQQILGACRYYAAFGLPGTAINRWMRQAGVWFGYGGSWTRSPGPVEIPQWFDDRQQFFGTRSAALLFLSNRGIQCLTGDEATCDSIVVQTLPPERLLRGGAAVSPNRYLGPSSSWGGWGLGGREEELLASMVRSLGRDRFQAFWTSQEPVPVAFEKATGTPLGAWVSSWAAEQYGPVQHGPRTSFLSVFGAIVIVTAGIGFTLWTARRRQYV